MDTSDLDYPESSAGDVVIVPGHSVVWREFQPVYTWDNMGKVTEFVETGRRGCKMVEYDPSGEVKNAVPGR